MNRDRWVTNATRRRLLCAIAGGCTILGYAHAGAVPAQARQDTPRRAFTLRIERRKLAGGTVTLRVVKGETVDLNWSTDEAAALHLHGYNLEAQLEPGKPGVMKFEAYATGRFPLVVHRFGAESAAKSDSKPHRETTLLYLEVHPR